MVMQRASNIGEMPDRIDRHHVRELAAAMDDVDATVRLPNPSREPQVDPQQVSQIGPVDHVVRHHQNILPRVSGEYPVDGRCHASQQILIRLSTRMRLTRGIGEESFTLHRITLSNLIPRESLPPSDATLLQRVDGNDGQASWLRAASRRLQGPDHRTGIDRRELDRSEKLRQLSRLPLTGDRQWSVDLTPLQHKRPTFIGIGRAMSDEKQPSDRGVRWQAERQIGSQSQTQFPVAMEISKKKDQWHTTSASNGNSRSG